MSAPQRLVVVGAAGRMGRAFLEAAAAHEDLEIIGAVVKSGDDAARRTLAVETPSGTKEWRPVEDGVPLLAGADAVVEFAEPAATARYARAAAEAGCAFLSGTTGLDEAAKRALEEAATRVAVFHAPNLSFGVAVLSDLVREAARRLGPGYDVEIIEAHHRMKADAPSGTALKLLDAVRGARGALAAVHGREGRTGPRPDRQIGVHAIRAGQIVGEHTVLFAGPGECIALEHSALSRACFAEGAVRAVRFLKTARPGLYGMDALSAAETGDRS